MFGIAGYALIAWAALAGTAHAADANCTTGIVDTTPVPAAGPILPAALAYVPLPGGAPSRLAQMMAQQAGLALPEVAPAAVVPHREPCTDIASAVVAQPAVAVGAIPPFAARVNAPDVFGSVAMAVSQTPLDDNWRRVRSASLGTGPWSAMLHAARGQDRATQLATINSWVNARIAFVDDIRRHGVVDRWALPAEALMSGRGDCEDYAIAKLGLLRSLGVPAGDMYLVIARDLVRRADHAVLAVRLDDRLVVLDNQTDTILDASAVQDYRPVMSYAGDRRWTHGYRIEPASTPLRTASAGVMGSR